VAAECPWRQSSTNTVMVPRRKSIQQNFPTLSQEQIHGAIAFYLGHGQEAEAYLVELERKWDQLERSAKPIDPDLQRRLEDARKRLPAQR
jgi:hypothetical protein